MTTIGRGLAITGEVTCTGDLTVECSVSGRVSVPDGTLVVGTAADLDADLRGARIVVLGRVRGSIGATYRLELGPTAAVDGDISADQIAIAEGARVNGAIDMGRRALAARVAEYRAGRIGATTPRAPRQ